MQNSISHQFVHMNPSERTFGANINLVKYNIWQNFTDVWFWRHLVHCGRWSESDAKITHQMRKVQKTIWQYHHCVTVKDKFKNSETRKTHWRSPGQWVELQTQFKKYKKCKFMKKYTIIWLMRATCTGRHKFKLYGTQSQMVWPW